MMNAPTEATLRASMAEQNKIADQIRAENPGLPMLTAIIMAGDKQGALRAHAMVEAGEWDVERAINLTGSYARLDIALTFWAEGRLSDSDLFADLPALWRGADPDDTDERFLNLWRAAFKANGYRHLRDGRALPRREWLDIYRGQMPDDTLGIAWSLDRGIAEKFAAGASMRTPTPGGVIYEGRIRRTDVMGYLTGRGESEVVVDPRYVVARKRVA